MLRNYEWEEIREDDMYLERIDLALEDLEPSNYEFSYPSE